MQLPSSISKSLVRAKNICRIIILDLVDLEAIISKLSNTPNLKDWRGDCQILLISEKRVRSVFTILAPGFKNANTERSFLVFSGLAMYRWAARSNERIWVTVDVALIPPSSRETPSTSGAWLWTNINAAGNTSEVFATPTCYLQVAKLASERRLEISRSAPISFFTLQRSKNYALVKTIFANVSTVSRKSKTL